MEKIELVSKAHARYIRVSPRKIRQVIDLIRGERVNRASAILANLSKGAKVYVQKVLKSAVSNAGAGVQPFAGELIISKITADSGPSLKRYRAAAMGRATMIRHRTTHLTVELAKTVTREAKAIKKKRPLKRKTKR